MARANGTAAGDDAVTTPTAAVPESALRVYIPSPSEAYPFVAVSWGGNEDVFRKTGGRRPISVDPVRRGADQRRTRWGGVMVHRYAAAAFRRYCVVRRLSPAEAGAELELFDDLVLLKELPSGEAGRWFPARTFARRPACGPTPHQLEERASWMT